MHYEDTLSRWVEVVRDLFPENADFDLYELGKVWFIDIDWPILERPDGTERLSRRFRMRFSRDVMNDYEQGHETVRPERNQRLRLLVEEALLRFDPKHDSDEGQQPIFDVLVPTTFLNAPV
jgi:hypothetical protein